MSQIADRTYEIIGVSLREEIAPSDKEGQLANNGTQTQAIELSPRELQILKLVVDGLTNRAIAAAIGCSVNNIKFHLANIYRKLKVRGRTEAAVYAIKNGLIQYSNHS